jgi:voltage-gated potassium channel
VRLNGHQDRALCLFLAVIAADLAFGVLFGYADHDGPWDGMYFAITTVTTVGYGDVTPHGWGAHLVAVSIMLLVVPLWAGVFSLVTTGLTAAHVDRRHAVSLDTAARAHQIAADTYRHVTGREHPEAP